jgi:hypothetical protein
MDISERQLVALRNLARKQAGEEVDWINISDARALVELGLAERSREGWKITTAGEAAIKDAPAEVVEASNDVVPMTGR